MCSSVYRFNCNYSKTPIAAYVVLAPRLLYPVRIPGQVGVCRMSYYQTVQSTSGGTRANGPVKEDIGDRIVRSLYLAQRIRGSILQDIGLVCTCESTIHSVYNSNRGLHASPENIPFFYQEALKAFSKLFEVQPDFDLKFSHLFWKCDVVQPLINWIKDLMEDILHCQSDSKDHDALWHCSNWIQGVWQTSVVSDMFGWACHMDSEELCEVWRKSCLQSRTYHPVQGTDEDMCFWRLLKTAFKAMNDWL